MLEHWAFLNSIRHPYHKHPQRQTQTLCSYMIVWAVSRPLTVTNIMRVFKAQDFTVQMPLLPRSQQHQSTEGRKKHHTRLNTKTSTYQEISQLLLKVFEQFLRLNCWWNQQVLWNLHMFKTVISVYFIFRSIN